MRRLKPGKRVVLTASEASLECTVVALAGEWALLSLDRPSEVMRWEHWPDNVHLSFVQGLAPVAFRGVVQAGRNPGELRFRSTAEHLFPERRASARVPVCVPAQILANGGAPIDGHTVDVSAGGLRMRHLVHLENQASARVEFELPGGLAIDATVEVRNAEPGVSSLRFTEFHEGSAEGVAEWSIGLLRAQFAYAI